VEPSLSPAGKQSYAPCFVPDAVHEISLVQQMTKGSLALLQAATRLFTAALSARDIRERERESNLSHLL
jgi:hypothetical protein